MTDDQAINEYARITRKLKDARKGVLESEGMTEDSLQTVHDHALCLMQEAETVETQWGTLQKLPDVPIQWSAHRAKDGYIVPMKSSKKRLVLLTREKSPHTRGATP